MSRPAILLAVSLAGCPARAPTQEPIPAAPTRSPLETAKVETQIIKAQIGLQGELVPYETVALYARVQGFVDRISVDRGSPVKAGQVLVQIHAPELLAQRAEAEAKAHADDLTQKRLRTAASTPGAVSKQELDQADAAYRASASRVAALRAQEQYLVVRAPFDGVVTERNVHPGALVGPPPAPSVPPILRVEQLARLRLTIAVPEAYASTITQGAMITFSVRAWPRDKFSAPVARSAHAIDPKTRTMAVELDVNNADARLASGMFAQVTWPVVRTAPSLLVPVSAVVRTTERTFVDRVRDGVVEQVAVQFGLPQSERVEVFGALQDGDVILKRGREDLPNGSPIEPLEAGRSPAAGQK
ncbi:MAG: efflux RND transporter periplasmic adaptor subunit [Elusimicrobia bacterium]|nr:MAG: efflux RND transporter periplasmic adaptor subunit [Elusimicrobiota bacterium]